MTDPCWGGPKIITAYHGQNINIICNYAPEFRNCKKYVYKEDGGHLVKDIRSLAAHSQGSRFSASYKRSAAVLSVNISDVREADGGVYLCGMMNNDQQNVYYSFFPDIRLEITGKTFIHV